MARGYGRAMRRISGLVAIGLLVLGACSSSADDAADSAPTTTAPSTTSASAATTTTAVRQETYAPFIDDGRACAWTTDDQADVYLVCAEDHGFPAVRGAAFSNLYVIAIVDPGTTVSGKTDRGWEELDTREIDGIHVVDGGPVWSIRWVSADGSTGELPIGYDSILGDDPIRLDGGVATAHGVDVEWALWFTRAEAACMAFTPSTSAEVYPVCLSPWDELDVAQWDASLSLPNARPCDASPGGVVSGLSWADRATAAEIRYGDHLGDVRLHDLPNGDTVALGFVVYDYPPSAEAQFTVRYDGQETRRRLGLPQPAGPIATYPDGCPSPTTPTTVAPGPTTTSPPTPTYPVYPSL